MPRNLHVEGYGFIPSESQHHFLITIPSSKKDFVAIRERFTWNESEGQHKLSLALGREDEKLRVLLPHQKWNEIADAARSEFNQRLRKRGLKTGMWKVGDTPVERLFGKELVLLAWAIEDVELDKIPVGIKNWLGLTPEERWWLYTMTNAATGHAISGRNKGWRKALRYALTENPVSGYIDSHRDGDRNKGLFDEFSEIGMDNESK